MDSTSIDAELQRIFPKSSLEDWKKIAVQETGAKDPFEKLSWRGKDEVLFLPYYDAVTNRNLHFPKNFELSAANTSRRWLNLPSLNAHNQRQANIQAHEHLMNGADGVVFDVRQLPEPDVKTLTNNIEWPHCYIAFYSDDNPLFAVSVHDLIQNTLVPASVKGAFFWESIPKRSNLDFYLRSCPSFRALGLLIRPSSPAHEISIALMNGVDAFEAFKTQGTPAGAFRAIAFSMPADETFLETIAKLKALRMLWFQIAQAYGFDDYAPGHLFLHTRSEFVPDAAFGPHENMIKGAFAAMAALIGGCNGLTVESDESAPFTARSARNISSILKEESFFDRAADPLGGAWALDALTDAIAQKAWDLFQQKCKTHATT